jgi:hypothetical protein
MVLLSATSLHYADERISARQIANRLLKGVAAILLLKEEVFTAIRAGF